MTGFSNFEPAMSGKWLELLKEIAPSVMALESMGMTSVRPPNPAAARRDAMQALWKDAGLEMVETRVIRIQTAYANFDDFWDSNTVPIGPQGKVIAGMSTSAKAELRTRLRDHLPKSSNGSVAYQSFANAVKGRVPA
jgi:hypothetical protein